MKNSSKILALLSTGLLASSVFAFATSNTPTPTPDSPSMAEEAAAGANAPISTPTSTINVEIIYCPPVKKLRKNNQSLIWGAPGGWRSYSQSFVNEIKSFVGAQWVGVEVGKMLCVYKGSGKLTFPVVLQNDSLTTLPKGGKWGSYKGGYVNCPSSEIDACPFRIEKEDTSIEKAYESLDFFKGKKDPLADDNS